MAEKLYYDGKEIGKDAIVSFLGTNLYLSNFSEYPVSYENITYKSSEAAFQAQKTLDNNERKKFSDLDPSKAKSLGRRIKLREDWEEVKDNIMYEIVKSKFDQNPDIKEKLINTGDKELYEGNTWNDKYWGVVKEGNNLIGKNTLGKILMKIRERV